MIKKTFTVNNIERKIFTVFTVGILASFVLYSYFIGAIVFNTAKMSSVLGESQILSSNVGDLETEYFLREKNLTLSYAYSIGFKEPKDVVFTSRKTFAINVENER